MNRLLKFFGYLFIVGVIGLIGYYLYQNFQPIIISILAIVGFLALIFIGIRIYYGENWMINLGVEYFISTDLVEATNVFLKDLPKPKTETTANLLAHLIYRFTRLGIFAFLFALVPVFLLFQQNNLLNQQNNLITKQNNRLDQQTYLQEAERRGSLVFLFSNIMDAIDKELKDDIGEKEKRDLSPQLIGRIIALSTRLVPYHYLYNDNLRETKISPERGQLLVTLVESQLDTSTYKQIFAKADFSEADLENAKFNNAFMVGINLEEANLIWSEFVNADLRDAHFANSILISSQLDSADLRGAFLTGADLQGAFFYKADLRKARLWGATMKTTDFQDAELDEVFIPSNWLDSIADESKKLIEGTEYVLGNYVYSKDKKRIRKKGFNDLKKRGNRE